MTTQIDTKLNDLGELESKFPREIKLVRKFYFQQLKPDNESIEDLNKKIK